MKSSCSRLMGPPRPARRMSRPWRRPTTRNRPRRRRSRCPGAIRPPRAAFYGFSFSVAAGGRALTGVSVHDSVACTPAGSFPDSSQFVIPSVTVPARRFVRRTANDRVSSTTPRPSSPTPLPGTSRGLPRAGPRPWPGRYAKTSCSPSTGRRKCAPQTSSRGRRFTLLRREAQRAWTLVRRKQACCTFATWSSSLLERRPGRRSGPADIPSGGISLTARQCQSVRLPMLEMRTVCGVGAGHLHPTVQQPSAATNALSAETVLTQWTGGAQTAVASW